MGPQRIGQAARWLGKTTAQLQSISRRFMRQLNAELASADENGDLKGAMDDIQALRRQVNDLRQELASSAMKPLQEGKAALQEGKAVLKESESIVLPSPPLAPPSNKENRIAPPALSQQLPNLVNVPDDPE